MLQGSAGITYAGKAQADKEVCAISKCNPLLEGIDLGCKTY